MFVTSSRALAAHAQKNDVLYVRVRAREKVKICETVIKNYSRYKKFIFRISETSREKRKRRPSRFSAKKI